MDFQINLKYRHSSGYAVFETMEKNHVSRKQRCYSMVPIKRTVFLLTVYGMKITVRLIGTLEYLPNSVTINRSIDFLVWRNEMAIFAYFHAKYLPL